MVATPPPLASTKTSSIATITLAAANPIEMSASSRPAAAIRRAGTSSSFASRAERWRAAPNARSAGTQA